MKNENDENHAKIMNVRLDKFVYAVIIAVVLFIFLAPVSKTIVDNSKKTSQKKY